MRNDVTGGIGRVLEKLRIELTVPIYNLMPGVGKQREIGRTTLLLLLPFHHFLGAFDIVGAESENLRALLQLIVEQVFQLTQLSGAGTSPIAAIQNQHNILAAVL